MFTVIPEDTFNELQVDAGVILNSFDPANPTTPTAETIITATTGDITVECKPTYSDWGEDINNCPDKTMELQRIDGWDCRMSFTAVGTSLEAIKLSLGAADITAATSKITPRRNLALSDFAPSLWWVGDRSDGGLVAIELKNVLSTGGFSLKTTKNGKGQLTIELTGHVSINAQDVVPMVFYSIANPSLASITVTSAEGSTTGYTAITTNYTLKSDESYVYKLGTAAQDIAYGDELTSWTDWNGSADISATTGQIITVAAVNNSDEAVAVGSTTVTAKSGT